MLLGGAFGASALILGFAFSGRTGRTPLAETSAFGGKEHLRKSTFGGNIGNDKMG